LVLAVLAGLACASPAWADKTAEAEAAMAAGRDEDAVRLFGEVIAETAGDPDAQAVAYFGRGEAHAAFGHAPEAVADYTAALALPQDRLSRANTLLSRAEAYVDRRMNAEALADFAESQALSPDVIALYLARARLYTRLQRKDAALADYEAALRINPASHRALVGRAQILGLPAPETGARDEMAARTAR
jgi:tetratricopeptide (TPR) repeat protein